MFCLYFAIFLYSLSVEPLSGSRVNHIGCCKIRQSYSACSASTDETRRKILFSLANAMEWVRQQQKNGVWFDAPTSAWAITNMVVAGYVEDGGICSGTKSSTVLRIRELLQNTTHLSAGKLALVMLGLRSTCQDVTSFNKMNLVETMKRDLGSFPVGNFNNFYQYSLAVLALYVNNVVVPEKYGNKLIQYLSKEKQTTSSERSCISDTKAMAVIALSAIMKQKGMSRRFLKNGKIVVDKTVLEINGQIERGEIKNLVTLSHALQVLQIHRSPFTQSSSCEKLMTSITAAQNGSGSFGDLMTSLSLLAPLSGVSLLNLRNIACPVKKDNVAESDVLSFIQSLKRARQNLESKRTSSAIKEKVIVELKVGSAVDGIKVQTHPITVKVKKGASALDAMEVASKRDECFRFHSKQTSWGRFVYKICGISQNDNNKTYWMFYVNGKAAQVGPGKYVLKNKDIVVFRFQKSNW